MVQISGGPLLGSYCKLPSHEKSPTGLTGGHDVKIRLVYFSVAPKGSYRMGQSPDTLEA